MEISIQWNICRICLQKESNLEKTGQMKYIFKETNKLAQHLCECSGITMKPNDGLPDKICEECLIMANNAINFRKTCQSSNTYLQSILQRTKLASTCFKSEKLHMEYKHHKDVVELEGLNESGVIMGNYFEHSPHATQKNKSIGNIMRANTESLEDINKMYKEEIIIRNDTQLCADIFKLSKEMDNDIIQNVKKQKNTNSKQISAYTENKRETEQDCTDYIYETDVEHLEEDVELYYAYNESKKYDSLILPKNSFISEDKFSNEKEVEYVPENNFEYYNYVVDGTNLLRLEEYEIDEDPAQLISIVKTNNDVHQESIYSNAAPELVESKNYKEDKYNLNKETFLKHKNMLKPTTIPTESRKVRGLKNVTVRTSRIALCKHNIKHTNFKSFSDSRRYEHSVYICNICRSQFNNRDDFYLHTKKHRQERNYQCELCFKRFFTNSNLQAHLRIHTGEKPFECQYCGRRFSDRSSNLRHERIHTNEKPFQCDNCGKSFALATTLQSHIKIHTGERSYRCEPCGKSFKLPHHLKSHQMTTLHKATKELRN